MSAQIIDFNEAQRLMLQQRMERVISVFPVETILRAARQIERDQAIKRPVQEASKS